MGSSNCEFHEKYRVCPGCNTYQRRDRVVCPKCGYVLKPGTRRGSELACRLSVQARGGHEECKVRPARVKTLMEPGVWYTTAELNKMYNEKYGILSRERILSALHVLCDSGEAIFILGRVPGCKGIRNMTWALAGADPSDSPCVEREDEHFLAGKTNAERKKDVQMRTEAVYAVLSDEWMTRRDIYRALEENGTSLTRPMLRGALDRLYADMRLEKQYATASQHCTGKHKGCIRPMLYRRRA